ncbi:N-acetylmuramoyl-L-alanine amidase [Ornithinibacillus scapharcae]|uniref:N-acetylmuramoyl-L-alanine amidase n=1 Tax=Ornithinibacillus scapharcae TaxID=1147159 RepID=UPI000225BCB0|nr:N-acetylmuramoyl-L-alanine amidase [Ornithinibacillus scapharcae]
MRKANLIFAFGILIFLISLMPTLTIHAEELTQDHEKLLEVVTDDVTMYVSPSENADIVGELNVGDRLRTFAEQEGWVKTFYDGQPVWVYAKDLKILEERQVENTNKEIEVEKNTDKTSEAQEQPSEDSGNKEVEEIETPDKEVEADYNQIDSQEDFLLERFKPEHAITGRMEIPVGYIEPKEVQISEDTIQVTKYQLDGYNIMIDAGHGGMDPGAVSNGLLEKDITLATAKVIKQYLEQEGANVLFTREDDSFQSLQDRVNQSNSNDTDVFISLHYDYFSDPGVNGINTYFYHQQSSAKLAEKVHSALTDHLNMNDRGIRQEGYYVLHNNRKPAILLELGFMTNPGDLEKMKTDAYREDVAKAITDGLVDYFEEKK